MRVSVITPDATYFDGEAAEVVLPAVDGEMGVLPGHAPMIARLGHGVARIKRTAGGGDAEQVAVYGGFLKVQKDVVSVLAGGAAKKEAGADAGAAQRAFDEASKRVAELKRRDWSGEDVPVSELTEADEALRRARAYRDLLAG